MASKLKSMLDTAKLNNETAIVIMTDRAWHMEVFNFMLTHKNISRLKVAGTTYFIIKEMRIEIKPIDFYI
tara:strand:- start:969 stop:1178 length:210 start_codon:yes stop_codon:yes gene_type:complete